MTLVLKNATYIDWKSLEFIQTDIEITEGMSGSIHLMENISPSADQQVIDCNGKFVTKAFAVGHHHVYSALARGMPAPEKTPTNFEEILKYIWWNLDKSLDEDTVKASALVTAIASAKAGATFVIDHHASPDCINGVLDIIAEAFDHVGVSHLLCYEITDRYGKATADEAILETERYLQKEQGLIGLHASFTVSNETLAKAADLMKKYHSGIHIHVAEDVFDQQSCLDIYNMRVINRLDDYGLLDSPKTILAHCLHLDDTERNMVKNSRAWIVENMESNLNNKVGYFKGEGLGKNIMLGTDGMHSDMIRSAQAAFLAGHTHEPIDYKETYRRFRNVHHYLAQNGYNGDGENNLVVLDYPAPTPFQADNFLGHFIFGISSSHINDVISNGKLIVKDKILQTVDEREVLEFAKEQTLRLWKRMK